MLLQIALDKPEHLGVLPLIKYVADIVEIGTPLLKRFGVSALATAKEICPGIPILADSKTVDGGALEADLVFGSGASFMTVLSCASGATLAAVDACAMRHGTSVVLDTITETGKDLFVPEGFWPPASSKYVAVHASTDARLAGDTSLSHIDKVSLIQARGFQVSLAGGIGPDNLEAALRANPEILVVGSAITEATSPLEAAAWIKRKLP